MKAQKVPRSYTKKASRKDEANNLPAGGGTSRGTNSTRGKKKRASANDIDARTVVATNPFDDDGPTIHNPHQQPPQQMHQQPLMPPRHHQVHHHPQAPMPPMAMQPSPYSMPPMQNQVPPYGQPQHHEYPHQHPNQHHHQPQPPPMPPHHHHHHQQQQQHHHQLGPPPPQPPPMPQHHHHHQQQQQHHHQLGPPPPLMGQPGPPLGPPTPTMSQHQDQMLMPQQPYPPSQGLYCGKCQGEIYQQNQLHISCKASCRASYHIPCSGLTQLACDLLMKENMAEWVCDRCTAGMPRVPFVKYKQEA